MYSAISALAREARERVVVESPYLVLRGDGLALMRDVLQRGLWNRVTDMGVSFFVSI